MQGISAIKFYGLSSQASNNDDEERAVKKVKGEQERTFKRMPLTLLGPSDYWAEFSKQCDAIETLKLKNTPSDPLSLFVYQNKEGFRHFVVAHPETYWWYYNQQSPEQKCSYEVIRENEPSFLYFDLEYKKNLNPDKDGVMMTSTFIEIVIAYILKYFNTAINKEHVINLDSTSDEKFSRHLIFNLKDLVFVNNFHVGKFVKHICNDILDNAIDNKPNDILKLFKKKSLQDLIIVTDKRKKLFIDTAVYTKNRHFRIYKSTKWGKNVHLKIAPDCMYVPKENKNKDLQIFLDSLISFFPDKEKLKLLEFQSNDESNVNLHIDKMELKSKTCTDQITTSQKSQYPELDKYISNIIKPGRIRCVKHYTELNKIIYEIVGNRYCGNIGRCHKSNNIYWVVDLTMKCRFQKCHDEDCLGFTSNPESLPEKVCFEFNDELDAALSILPDP